MAICAVFVWYGIRLILDSARIGSMVVKTLAIPEWWQYALVPVCFSLLAVEFARRRLRGMTWWLSAIVLFGVLTALFLVGLPAAFAFFGINIVGAWFYLGKEAGLVQLIGTASFRSRASRSPRSRSSS